MEDVVVESVENEVETVCKVELGFSLNPARDWEDSERLPQTLCPTLSTVSHTLSLLY